MRKVDKTKMYNSVSEYKFNLMFCIFNTLKKNYHNICTFKANKAIKIASQCIFFWRDHVFKKNLKRKKVENFYGTMMINRYKEMLSRWSSYASHEKLLKMKMKHLIHKSNVL